MNSTHVVNCNCTSCASVHEIARPLGYRVIRTQDVRLDSWDRHDYGWEEQVLKCPETGERYYAILAPIKNR